jgi:aminopeptidase N
MNRFNRILILILLCAQQGFAQNRDISYMTSGGKLNPLQAIMDIRHYTLALDVDPAKQTIQGYCDVKLMLSQQTDTLLLDLVHLLKVSKVKVNNAPANFIHQNDKIYITGPKSFGTGQQTIYIEYGGEPPVAVKPPWDGGFTWTKDLNGNPWVVINCQGEGG